MSRHDDAPRLKDMLTHAEEAVRLCHGRNKDALTQDRVFSLALMRLLEIVGEAAARVSEQVRLEHPDIDWIGIIGLRNRLIHGYGDIDFDIVWSIVEDDLPKLVLQLHRFVDER